MTEHTDPTPATDGSSTVDDVLNHRIGNEEHPAEGRVEEAQREAPPDQGTGTRGVDPAKTDTETHDAAGDDEAVDEGSLLGVGTGDNDTMSDNASDDAHGIIGEEA